jgi:hypothetical protein
VPHSSNPWSLLQKPQNSDKQWENLWVLPTSGQYALMSISKFQVPNNGKQSNCAFKTLPLFDKGTTLPHSSTELRLANCDFITFE